MARPRFRVPWSKVFPVAIVLVLWELSGPIVYGYPGPVIYSGILLYNGAQSARTLFPNLTSRWNQRKAAGPPPDARVVAASNAFGLRILKEMAAERPGQNLFFSPYGLSASLALSAGGAEGQTREEMWKGLGLEGIDEETVHRSYNRLETLLKYSDPRIRVLSANALWADKSAGLRDDFADRARQSFHARVEEADLRSPASTDRINAWIMRRTNGKIDGVAPPPGPDSALVLANALYFEGTWVNQFKGSNTKAGTFFLEDGAQQKVRMMYQEGAAIDVAGAGQAFAVFRLPYGDGSMSMIILLPDRHPYYQYRRGDPRPDALPGLGKIIEQLTSEAWDQSMDNLHRETMSLAMPRFRYEGEPEVESAVKAAGVGSAFEKSADFSRMCDAPQGVFLSSLRQKAFLEVDEKGTRAGAITLHDMRLAGEPSSMKIDHPFLCAIRDDRTGLILFLGAIYDPESL